MTEHIGTLLSHGEGHLTTLAIAAAAKLLIALLTFTLFFGAALIAARLVRGIADRTPEHGVAAQIVARLIRILGALFGVISALGTLGIDVSMALTGIGLAGAAFSLAFKDVAGSLFGGVLIALYRPFKPGDRLTISGESGKVLAINLRHSVLIDGDRRIFIPNTLILSDPLIVEPCAAIPSAFQEK